MILRPYLADSNIWSAPSDPSSTFQAGNIAGLIEINGELFVTVSDGDQIPPIGIIDDNRTTAFTGTVVDEVIIVPAASQVVNNVLVSTVDVMGPLQETNIIESSFSSTFDLILNPKKGTFVIPAGTPLNYDDGSVMGFEVVVSYRYQIVDYPGDDSTSGSGKISIHFNRGIFVTDVFDVLSTYTPGCALYVNNEGMLTSQETKSPVVAIALQPASALNSELMFMWL
jgi:hypothetical protein